MSTRTERTVRAELGNVRAPTFGVIHMHRDGLTTCGVPVRPTWLVTTELPTCRRCLTREVDDSLRPFLDDGVGQEIEGV